MDVFFLQGHVRNFSATTSFISYLVFISVLTLKSHSNFEIKHNHLRTEERVTILCQCTAIRHWRLQSTAGKACCMHMYTELLFFLNVSIYLYSRNIQD